MDIDIKKIILISIFFIIIFATGFFIRVEAIELSNLNPSEKMIYFDGNENPYLQESDSYYNYRLTSNFLSKGYLGDKIVNNTLMDSYSYFPPGVPLDYPPLIACLAVFSYKIANIFSQISLLEICIWLPAIISSLCGGVGFLFVRRFAGNMGGFFTGMAIVTSVFYLLKTVPGFFDTDMFVIIFPLLIFWALFESDKTDSIRNNVLFACLAGLITFIFALAWNGWQYIYYCILLSFLFYFILGKIKKWDLKKFYIISISFIGSSLLLISTDPLNIYKLILGPFEYAGFLSSNNNIWYPWPDSYTSVRELKKASLELCIYLIGTFTVIFSILGISTAFWNEKKKNLPSQSMGWFFYILLFTWTILSIISLYKGVRFIGLALPPLAIFAGIFVGIIFAKFKSSKINLNQTKKYIVGFLVLLVILMPQCIEAYHTAQDITPFYTDDYAESAYWINHNTSNDTVIFSDWSYGHFYATVANRPVSFDGRLGYIETLPVRDIEYKYLNMSREIPNTSRDFWIDLGLNTSNRTLSRGIFTMLSTSGDNAYLALDQYTHNTSKTKEILENILGIKKELAKDLLINEYNLTNEEANRIVELTHPTVTRPFVIVINNNMAIVNKNALNLEYKKSYQNQIITVYKK